MAVTGTITRSRKNDFVEVTDEESEDELKQFVENATSGDHVTIHSGNYTGLPSDGKAIEIPQDVTITILGSADVQVNVSGNSFNYPIFGGATENIIDLNLLNESNFQTQIDLTINQLTSLNLENIVVDDSGSNPTFSVNDNDNSEIKFGKLDQDGILYINTSDGEVTTSSDLTYNSSNDIFRVKADQVIEGGLTVQSALSFGSATTSGPLEVNDLDSNRIVTTNSNSELITQDSLKFDGTNFILESNINLLYNKSSADGDADIHFKPNDGVLIEGTSGTTQDGSRLVINEDSIVSGRTLHVNQGGKSVGLFLKASDTNNEILRVRNTDQSSDILTVNANRTVELADVVSDTLSTRSSYIDVDSDGNNAEGGISWRGNGQKIRYNTSSSEWEFRNVETGSFTPFSDIHLSKLNSDRIVLADSNGDFTTSSDLTFDGSSTFIKSLDVDNISVTNGLSAGSISTSGEFITLNTDGTNANSGISVNGNVSIRYNDSQSQWEFTDDGNNYTAFNNISTSTYEEKIITKGNVQDSVEITVSSEFSGSPTLNDVSLRTWVKDSTSGNPSSGDWIDAIGIITVVRDFNNNYPYDYKVYNEHPNSQDFKFVLRKFK